MRHRQRGRRRPHFFSLSHLVTRPSVEHRQRRRARPAGPRPLQDAHEEDAVLGPDAHGRKERDARLDLGPEYQDLTRVAQEDLLCPRPQPRPEDGVGEVPLGLVGALEAVEPAVGAFAQATVLPFLALIFFSPVGFIMGRRREKKKLTKLVGKQTRSTGCTTTSCPRKALAAPVGTRCARGATPPGPLGPAHAQTSQCRTRAGCWRE